MHFPGNTINISLPAASYTFAPEPEAPDLNFLFVSGLVCVVREDVTRSRLEGHSIIDRHVFVVVVVVLSVVDAGKCSRRVPMKMSNGNLALVLILLVSCSGADLATEFAETSEGGSASLPCNLEPVQPPDKVVNVLWYR